MLEENRIKSEKNQIAFKERRLQEEEATRIKMEKEKKDLRDIYLKNQAKYRSELEGHASGRWKALKESHPTYQVARKISMLPNLNIEKAHSLHFGMKLDMQ